MTSSVHTATAALGCAWGHKQPQCQDRSNHSPTLSKPNLDS